MITWVIYTTGRGAFPELSLLRFTTHTCLLGTVSIIVLTTALTWNEPPITIGDVSAVSWQILYMALPATVLAVLTWNHAAATLGASNGVLFINLVPITAFIIEAIRGHQPTGGEIAGVACASCRKPGHPPQGQSHPTDRGHPSPERCTQGTKGHRQLTAET